MKKPPPAPAEPPFEPPARPRVLTKTHTRLGFAVVGIPWQAVPGYDHAAACEGLDAAAIRMEIERDWTVTRGKQVYPNYNEMVHVAKEPLAYYPELPLRLGWDVPGCPACCIAQINPFNQLQLFPPICAEEKDSVSIYEFGERVANHLLRTFAAPQGLGVDDLEIVHVGDPAGRYKPVSSGLKKTETRVAFEVLSMGSRLYMGEDEHGVSRYEERPGWGWVIQAGASDHTTRQNAVNQLLTTLVSGGLPALLVDPRAGEIRRALNGGYHYEDYGDGTFSRDPIKNQLSHIANAFEYLCTRLHSRPVPRRRVEDEDEEQTPRHVSMAAGRDRY